MPKNPIDKSCWVRCTSCFKCQDKGKFSRCASCSGKDETNFPYDPYYRDDYCDCKNGILRHRTREGRFIVVKFPNDPFNGRVSMPEDSVDEREWKEYVRSEQEKRDDPNWDPVQIYEE